MERAYWPVRIRDCCPSASGARITCRFLTGRSDSVRLKNGFEVGFGLKLRCGDEDDVEVGANGEIRAGQGANCSAVIY